jgi:RHS repeat-associated protein
MKGLGELFPNNEFSHTKHGNTNISKINGNLTFSLPLSEYSINGYPVSLSLNYTGNLSTTSYAYCLVDKGYWTRFHQNRPGWIIGVNGFAIQVLSGNAMFTCDPRYQNQAWLDSCEHGVCTLTNKDLTWMIDGYDVCNDVYAIGKGQSQDVIKILKSDGTLMEFRNQNVILVGGIWTDEKYFTGKYYINEINSTGYAIVEFDNTQANTSILNDFKLKFGLDFKIDNEIHQRQRKYFQPRVLKYYPGDGYEYVFKEHKIPYGINSYTHTNPHDDIIFHEPNELRKSFGYSMANSDLGKGPLSHPTIFYLYKINNDVKEIALFEYTKFGSFQDYTMKHSIGRSTIRNFPYHSFAFGGDFMTIQAFDKKYTVKYKEFTHDGYYADDSPYNKNPPFKYLPMFANANTSLEGQETSTYPLNIPYLYYSSLGYITEIESDNLKYTFKYEDYNKLYKDCKFPITDYELFHKIELTNKRMLQYVSYSDSVVFSYMKANLTEIDPNPSQDHNYSSTNAYVNNVIDSVIYFSKSAFSSPASPLKREYYSYNFTIYPGNILSKMTSNLMTFDYRTGKNTTLQSEFNKYTINPYIGFSNTDNPQTTISHSNVKLSTFKDETDQFETIYTYNAVDANTYRVMPLHIETKVKKAPGEYITKDSIRKSYFWGTNVPDKIEFANDTINSKYGFLLKADTTFNYYANGSLNNKTVNTYSNFLKESTENLIFKRLYPQKLASQELFRKLKREGDPRVKDKDWEDTGCDLEVYRAFIDSQIRSSKDKFGILESSINFSQDNIISSGISNKLNYNFIGNYYLDYSVGKVLVDTIIGVGGLKKIGNHYGYLMEPIPEQILPNPNDPDINLLIPGCLVGDENSYGLLNKVTNSIGAFTGMYYDYNTWHYTEIYPLTYETFSSISGKQLRHNDNLEIQDIVLSRGYSLNTVPLINIAYVRKYRLNSTDDLVIDIDTLTEFKAKNYMGRITQSIDLNGWLSEYKYDENGRLTRAWLPYDFPDDQTPLNLYNSLTSTGFAYDTTKYRAVIYECWTIDGVLDSLNMYESPLAEEEYGEFTGNSMYAGNYYNGDRVFKCRCETPQGGEAYGENNGLDSGNEFDKHLSPSLQHIDPPEPHPCYDWQSRIYMRDSHFDVEFDKPGRAINIISLDTLIIRFEAAQIFHSYKDREDIVLSIQSRDENLGIDQDYTIDPSIFNEFLGFPISNNYFEIEITNQTCLELVRNILNTNSSLKFKVSIQAEDVGILFSDAEIELLGVFYMLPYKDTLDYTIRVDYSDPYNSYQKELKIDDINHSNNIFNVPSQGFPARRIATSTGVRRNKVTYTSRNGQFINGFVYDANGNLIYSEDALHHIDSLDYDLFGNVREVVNKGGESTKQFAINYSDDPENDFEVSHPGFNGFCKQVISTDEIGNRTESYFDTFNRLLLKNEFLVDMMPPYNDILVTTQYEYDSFGRLIYVIDPHMDTVKYWYDEFGNIKYKFHKDLGYTSYSYDKVGNLRFSQDQNQADSNKLTFYEYDDLNRIIASGQTTELWQHGLNVEPIPNEVHENYVFGRFTDILNPNIIYNAESDLLTLNSTLYSKFFKKNIHDPNRDKNLEMNEIQSFWGYPIDCWRVNSILNDTTEVPLPMIYHPVNTNNDQDDMFVSTSLYEIENFFLRPNHLLNTYHYDDFPLPFGPVWSYIQEKSVWDALAPTGEVRNTRGKISTMAYRENGKQEFNFIVFSYDERGRVEAMLRFTENLGFDGIYYKYNSSNLVMTVTVVDPIRHFSTWYGYDTVGRVDTVWSKVSEDGFHFQNSVWNQLPTKPVFAAKPAIKDFNYGYTLRDQVASITYGNLYKETFQYNPRGWFEFQGLIAGSTSFLSSRIYKSNGLIERKHENYMSSSYQFQSNSNFQYDTRNQLVGVVYHKSGDMPLNFNFAYDLLGNRLMSAKNIQTGAYSYSSYIYDDHDSPNRLTEFIKTKQNNLFDKHVFQEYHSDGALHEKYSFTTQSIPGPHCPYDVKIEEFFYNYLNLTNKYVSQTGPSCTIDKDLYFQFYKTEWRYRFNPFGEREQKRMYNSPNGESYGWVYPWVYYLLGPDNRQYATYYGSQTSDHPIVCNQSGINKPDQYRSTTFFYPVEYNVFGNSMSPKITYKYIDGVWKKHIKVYDYLGSLRFTLGEDKALLNYKQYEPYGETMLDTFGLTRQSYIGKEKEPENNLGDHGVRKYDYETGRFNSIDPLWDKFYGWNPYQYCFNNPIRFYDNNGLLPGDPFESEAQAAHDFGKNYIEKTRDNNAEYGTMIYSYVVNGETKYSYMVPEKGSETQVTHPFQMLLFLQ